MTYPLNGIAPLSHLGVIRVEGEDAAKFLHGQLTQDFALLDLQHARLAAFLSAKGRMQASFIGFKRTNGDILLVNTAINSLTQDGIYVIELDGHDYVKLLQKDFSTGGVQVISYNPAYKPQLLGPVQAADLRISGRGGVARWGTMNLAKGAICGRG